MHHAARLLPLLAVLLVGCAGPEPQSDELPDGVYEVLAVERDAADLPAADAESRVLLHDRRFVQGGAEVPPDHVLVRLPGFAPLELAEAPTPGQADGRPVLLLTLSPAAGQALTELTTRAEHAAVLIGGQVVTVHRIRAPIEGGTLQVSC